MPLTVPFGDVEFHTWPWSHTRVGWSMRRGMATAGLLAGPLLGCGSSSNGDGPPLSDGGAGTASFGDPSDPLFECIGKNVDCSALPATATLSGPSVPGCDDAAVRPTRIVWAKTLAETACAVPPCRYQLPRAVLGPDETIFVLADVVSAARDQVLGYTLWRYDPEGNLLSERRQELPFSPVLAPRELSAPVAAFADELVMERAVVSEYGEYALDLFVERQDFAGTVLGMITERGHLHTSGIAPGSTPGEVLVAARSAAGCGALNTAIELARYSADGALVYNQSGLARYFGQEIHSVRATPAGRAMILGGTGYPSYQCVLAHIDAEGNVKWALRGEALCAGSAAGPHEFSRYFGIGAGRFYNRQLAVAPDGAAYVVTRGTADDGLGATTVFRVAPDGIVSWSSATVFRVFGKVSLAADANSNVWVSASPSEAPEPAMLFRISPQGECTSFDSGIVASGMTGTTPVYGTLILEALSNGRLFYVSPGTAELGVLATEE